jgi:uncharacterized membrane protein YGL010W
MRRAIRRGAFMSGKSVGFAAQTANPGLGAMGRVEPAGLRCGGRRGKLADSYPMATHRKSADQWFAEYGESHQDGTNETIHWICVPVIFFSVMGLLWSLPVPAAIAGPLPWFNWLHPLLLGALAFYFRLSPPLAFGLLGFMSVCYCLIEGLVLFGRLPLWQICVGLFVLAWIGQFIGHKIEGKKPSFLKDVVFLLIGPAWLMHFLYKKMNIEY